jgi:DNA polymerase-4
VTTIGELAAMSEQSLVDNFGPAHGHYLYQAARGIDNAPLITHWEPKSLSHETTFQHDVNNWEIIDKTLNELTRELVERLQRQAYLAHNVTVKLRYADFDTHTHSKSLATATDDRELIQQSAQQCLHKFALIKKVRLVGIRLGGLSKMTMVNRQRTVSIDGI